MRKFMVYLDKVENGCEQIVEYLMFPYDTPQSEIDEVCSSCLDTLISNEIETGWLEIV